MRTIYILAILVLLALAVPPAPVHAGGVVTVCDEAHLLAALAGGGTVTFSCSGVITLTNTIVVSSDMAIDGAGQEVTLSGNNAVRVFTVNDGVTLNLNQMTIADGSAGIGSSGGGGISNSGTVAATHCGFSGNNSAFSNGGAIINLAGVVDMDFCTFSDNSTVLGGYGGAIHSVAGTLTVNNSSFSSNHAAGGGGINNVGGMLTVTNSSFSDHARGAIYNSSAGMLTVNRSTFTNNSGFDGGGIGNTDGHVVVSESTFSGNQASLGHGGGISSGGVLTVGSCSFSGNGGDRGGGISNSGVLTVTNSTFSGNFTLEGGAIFNSGALMMSNSTFTDNVAVNGSAILSSGVLEISNSTFAGNSSMSGYGAISNSGAAALKNTIVANSLDGDNCAGTITDGGGNLSFPDTTCPGINADPKLGPLQNNLGPTLTMALGSGSAAIDVGIDAICAAAPVNGLDQRGIARPWGAHCDIGAVEQLPIKKLWLPILLSR